MKEKVSFLLIYLLTLILTLWSLTLTFISLDSISITLWGLSTQVSFEGTLLQVSSSFTEFNSAICHVSQSEEILCLCSGISSLHLSSLLQFIASLLSLFLSTFALYLNINNIKSISSNLSGPSIYFIGSVFYLILASTSVNSQKLRVSYNAGFMSIVLINFCHILNLSYFFKASSENSPYFLMNEGKTFSTEELIFQNRQKNEETNPTEKLADQLRSLENKNTALLEKLKIQDQVNWEGVNSFKACLEKSVSGSKSQLDRQVLENMQDQVEKLIQDLYTIKQREFDIEKSNLLFKIQQLETESSKNVDQSIRNQVFSLQAERNELLIKLEQANSELKRVQEPGDRAVSLSNFQHSNNEIIRLNQEIAKLQKTAQDKTQKLFELENELKKLKDKEVRYKEYLEEIAKAMSDSPGISSQSEIDFNLLNDQLSNYIETIKRSKFDSHLDSKLANLESENEKIFNSLAESENKYKESLLTIDTLRKELEDFAEVKKKFLKNEEEKKNFLSKIENLQIQDSKKTLDLEATLKKYEHIKKERKVLNKKCESLEKQAKEIEAVKENNESLKNDLKKYIEDSKKQEEEWERVRSELTYSSVLQTKELEALQNRLKSQESFFENELKTTQMENSLIKDQLTQVQSISESYKNECARLKSLESTFISSTPDSLEDYISVYKDQSKSLKKALESISENLSKVTKEKEKLRKKLKKTEEELLSLSEEYQSLNKSKVQKDFGSFLSFESYSHSIHDSIIIEGVSPSIVFHNPLIEKISQLRKEPAMTQPTMWKLIENYFTDKRIQDILDVKEARQVKGMSEFLLDFMSKTFGLKSLGLKQLKALLTTLEDMYKVNHPYVIIICRILGVFHPRPLPTKVSEFLLRVHEKFNSKRKKQESQDLVEILQYGGDASIVDIVKIVQEVFNRESGERVIDRLHANQPDKLQISLIKISSGMSGNGISAESFFAELSRDNVIDYQEMVDGLRVKCNIWLSIEDCEQICVFLDKDGDGQISLQDWLDEIDFNNFLKMAEEKPALVTKAELFSSIIAEYEKCIIEDYQKLRKIAKGKLSQDKAMSCLEKIDTNLTEEVKGRVFKEALRQDGGHEDEISAEAFCVTVLKYGIGGYGKSVFR